MKQRKYKTIDIIKIENRTCADYEISGLIIEDNLIRIDSIAIRNKEIVFNKSKYEIQKITVDKTKIVQNLANDIAIKAIFNALRDFHEHRGRLCNRCMRGVHGCIVCG